MNYFSGKIKLVKIAYFSGTGGTSRVAACFERAFIECGINVLKYRIGQELMSDTEEDMLVVLYPVHACNAPEPVYEWIDKLSYAGGIHAAVVSVSGGGEISPNTACRASSIKRLRKKGYDVVYEDMIVMPSNWIVPTIEDLAVRLLKVLPLKAGHIVEDLLQGTIRRTTPSFQDRFFSKLGELEKLGAIFWGRSIKATSDCNTCKLCEKNCPRKNISLKGGIPAFGWRCAFCLKCIYGCPQKALKPRMFKFIIIKEGYDLEAIESKIDNTQLAPVEEIARGYLWKGIKEYLLNFERVKNQ